MNEYVQAPGVAAARIALGRNAGEGGILVEKV